MIANFILHKRKKIFIVENETLFFRYNKLYINVSKKIKNKTNKKRYLISEEFYITEFDITVLKKFDSVIFLLNYDDKLEKVCENHVNIVNGKCKLIIELKPYSELKNEIFFSIKGDRIQKNELEYINLKEKNILYLISENQKKVLKQINYHKYYAENNYRIKYFSDFNNIIEYSAFYIGDSKYLEFSYFLKIKKIEIEFLYNLYNYLELSDSFSEKTIFIEYNYINENFLSKNNEMIIILVNFLEKIKKKINIILIEEEIKNTMLSTSLFYDFLNISNEKNSFCNSKVKVHQLLKNLNKKKLLEFQNSIILEIEIKNLKELFFSLFSQFDIAGTSGLLLNYKFNFQIPAELDGIINIFLQNENVKFNASENKNSKSIKIPFNVFLSEEFVITLMSEVFNNKIANLTDTGYFDEFIHSKNNIWLQENFFRLDYTEIFPCLVNVFPTESNLYQNQFIYTKMKTKYIEDSKLYIAFKLLPINSEPKIYSFRGAVCISISVMQFVNLTKLKIFNVVECHFLNNYMSEVVKRSTSKFNIHIHGFEGQNLLIRRPFLFVDNLSMEEEKKKTVLKQKNFSGILNLERVKLIFVSSFQVSVFNNDINSLNNSFKYSVIPNPIDGKLFSFKEKTFKRLKFLSIRPFASTVYANDVVINAILILSKFSFFSEMEFTICGAGKLYKTQVEELESKKFKNVYFVNKFLSHNEIKKLHDGHNIFICPSRTDTQGVSRCEAMASGLVTIGSDVGGVSEFNFEGSGFLLKDNSVEELVSLIKNLFYNRDELKTRSKKGSEFILAKCNKKLNKESLFFNKKQKKKFNKFKNKIYVNENICLDIFGCDEDIENIIIEYEKHLFSIPLPAVDIHLKSGCIIMGEENIDVNCFYSSTIFSEEIFVKKIRNRIDYTTIEGKNLKIDFDAKKIFLSYNYVNGIYSMKSSEVISSYIYVYDWLICPDEMIHEYIKKLNKEIQLIVIYDNNNNCKNIISTNEFLNHFNISFIPEKKEILDNDKIMKFALKKEEI